jgi:hypothetical protein
LGWRSQLKDVRSMEGLAATATNQKHDAEDSAEETKDDLQ